MNSTLLNLKRFFVLLFLIYIINSLFFGFPVAFSEEDAVDFIFMHSGTVPQSGSFEGLKSYMLEHPEYVESLSKKGFIRIVINSNEGSSKDQLLRAESIKKKINEIFEEVGIDFKKRGLKRFIFKPISVSFIPIDIDSKLESTTQEIKKDIDNVDDSILEEKMNTISSEFSCSSIDSCIDNTLKKFVATNELIEKRIKEITDKTQEQYSSEDINDIARQEVQNFFKSFNEKDRILVLQILSKNFSKPMSDIIKVFNLENIIGIDKNIIEDIENKLSKLPIDRSLNKTKKDSSSNKKTNKKTKYSFLSNLFYIPVALAKSLRVPFKDLSVSEMFQGLLPKTLAMAGAISVYSATYQDIPWAWWTAISLYLAQSSFHSIESSGWMDFQNRIKQEKGESFQKKFNMGYSLMWIMLYRSIAYASGNIPNFIGLKDGFISLQWLVSMYVIQIVAINISTRGYNALNDLHYKQGVVDKRSRDFLKQWIRDALNAVCGAFIGTGGENNYIMFLIFAIGLMIDESFWVVSQTVEQAPILILGDKTVLNNDDIKIMYPHLQESNKTIPVKSMNLASALKTSVYHIKEVMDSIFKPISSPVKKVIKSCTNYFTQPPNIKEAN